MNSQTYVNVHIRHRIDALSVENFDSTYVHQKSVIQPANVLHAKVHVCVCVCVAAPITGADHKLY